MGNNKRFWKGLEELNNDADFVKKSQDEFDRDIPVDELLEQSTNQGLKANRRDFLKFMGFSIGAATLAACSETPVKYALPYVIKQDSIMPGVANYYASTFYDGLEYVSILVKTREGRPIKIEGNKNSPITKGGTSVRSQASVLGLYDNKRYKFPTENGKELSWTNVDIALKEAIKQAGGQILIFASTIVSPTTKKLLAEFAKKYEGKVKVVQYDSLSASGLLSANDNCFGKAVVPAYKFDKAKVIVGFNCDFLGTWLSPVEYTKQYVEGRRLLEKKEMSKHYQFETNLSLTGANADIRIPMKPSQEAAALLALYNAVAAELGKSSLPGEGLKLAGNSIEAAAKDLAANKGNSLVVSGSNDTNVQTLVNGINSLLGNYGSTIDLDNYGTFRAGNDSTVKKAFEDMAAGTYGTVFFLETNPMHTYPNAEVVKNAIKGVKVRVSFATREDETSAECNYILPNHHYLESWGDVELYKGNYSFIQPTINPLFKTRAAQSTFLMLLGDTRDYYTYLKDNWSANILKSKNDADWNKALHDGTFVAESAKSSENKVKEGALKSAADEIVNIKGGGIELMLYAKNGIADGSMSTNPWIMEFPDPISKISWDNYVTISKKLADKYQLNNEDVVKVKGNGFEVKLPVYIIPGQTNETIGIALGYGRKMGTGEVIGKNVVAFAKSEGNISNYVVNVTLEKTSETYPLAATQTHHTIMGREEEILREYSLPHYAGGKVHHHEHDFVTLWGKHDKNGHYWGMVIDLSACTGCGTCVVSCQAENNIPVVGKEEVRTRREMHWIRIDRYFSSDLDTKKYEERTFKDLTDMENPSEYPKVVFQPMMCQHCDNAPCETVCPVLAIAHSSEGLNQQVYNRCVGTRYCANNCPYKVRRFNWFDYTNSESWKYNPVDDLGRMVLNPDVVVRARGTMEKCSMCIQRIQDGKLKAKTEGRKLIDGEIQTACASACPADAIIFGDLNDPNSRVSKYFKADRAYLVIEEVKTKPHVAYLAKIRNVNDSKA